MGDHLPEILIIVAIAAIFLGPKRLPDAGKALGQAIRGFREETKGIRQEFAPLKDDVSGLKSDLTRAHESVKTTVADTLTGSSAQS